MVPDGQRAVRVGPCGESLLHEQVAGQLAHGVQDPLVLDPSLFDLLLDHPKAEAFEILRRLPLRFQISTFPNSFSAS